VYLKSLTLKGFKSFAAPTTFEFERGVTCVIGPNGSGKSNVVDALAWVMGEQGAKTLRGGKMEDVIFAGTATKGPLGRAEVILTIDNSDGLLPIEYSEVTISRTLFRSGGSEYAINGEACRLLDVQELLSDTGLGREMHVIVGQGQLDAVLYASPEDRRGFIEEAAGILKHRRRKEKTLRKLEAMQANLTRLNDLAGEIRRQLKPLGRQAEIAKEAQSIASVVRDARARLLADEVVALREAIEVHSRGESERKTERVVLQEQLDQNKLREQHIERTQAGEAVDSARRTAYALESVQERLRALYTLANQKAALLGQQAEEEPGPATVTEHGVQEAREEAQRLGTEVTACEDAARSAAEGVAAARLALESLDEELAAQSALITSHELQAARLGSQVDIAASKLASATEELARQRHGLEQAAERRETSRAEFAAYDAEAGEAGDGSLEADYDSAEKSVAALRGEAEGIREQLHALERERDALAARVSALSMALDQKDGSRAVVGAGIVGIRGLVAEHVKVRPGYEPAIAAALGSLSDAVLADTHTAALDGLAVARGQEEGRVEIVVADAAPGASLGELPPGALAARELVTAPAGIMGILARVVVVEDLESARSAWQSLRAIPEVTVITRLGDVLTEYVLRGGSGAKRSRLELVAEREAAEERLGATVERIEASRAGLDAGRAALTAAQERAAESLARLREADARSAAVAEQLGRLRMRADSAHAEWERLAESIELAEDAVKSASAELERARAERDAFAQQPQPILDASARDGLAAALEEARAAELERRIELETARERVRTETARAEALARQLAAERAAAQERARQAVIRGRQRVAAEAVLGQLPAVLDSVDRSVSQARVELAAREAERAEQNEELAGLRRGETVLRERLAAVNESVHTLEMQVYEKRLLLSSLLERAAQELGLIEEVLIAEYGPETPVPVPAAPDAAEPAAPVPGIPFVRAEQEARLAAAERKLEQLGRVNPLALEEFEALEQRHKFLVEQLADLTATRKDLLTIIEEIDGKMEDIFRSAFEDTRQAFDEVFPVLFPGGSGSLRLTDPESILTTGIEVTVKPAGKKIERLSLLSGGERSLAAVALLIAIFKARPSPFYILDEVEAALDDANLGRLLAIFDDLRRSSQLIVITHQKRTMELADTLYGVSMRSDGVSAVVGQRLEREPAREPIPEGVGQR